jgi:hypothetical protein
MNKIHIAALEILHMCALLCINALTLKTKNEINIFEQVDIYFA